MMKNKKAELGLDFIFGMIGFFTLILIVVSLLPVQEKLMAQENATLALNNTQTNTLSKFSISPNNNVVVNIVHSYIYFVIYTTFEVSKIAVNYAVANPGFVNAKTLLWLIIASLLVPIIYYAAILFIIIFILIKDLMQHLAERRRLKRLAEARKRNYEYGTR